MSGKSKNEGWCDKPTAGKESGMQLENNLKGLGLSDA